MSAAGPDQSSTARREVLASLADGLAEAERSRRPRSALSAEVPDLTSGEAYEIQTLNIQRRVAQGRRVSGHKVGLTARAMQELFGVHEPDYGHLLDDMFAYEGIGLALDNFIEPYVEVECAFILGRRLAGPGLTVADVLRAVEMVVPAIEVIDSRIRNWDIRLVDTIADNGSSAAVILGGRGFPPYSIDYRSLSTELFIDDKLVSDGNTREVLGNPISAVTWLANALGVHGTVLEEGEVILPGTSLKAIKVPGPCWVKARFQDLGEVAVEFVNE